MKTKKKCPECGQEMVEAEDWSDEWLVCLNCQFTEEFQREERPELEESGVEKVHA